MNMEINPPIKPKNNSMVTTTANVLGNFSFLRRKRINGLAINDKTAAMMIYTITDCILYKK
jgi:hypothetical protein